MTMLCCRLGLVSGIYIIYCPCFYLSISIPIYLLYLWIKKQEGASKEDIEQLSKFKFRKVESNEKQTDNNQGPVGGIMTECRADSPIEHVLAEEDAVCYNSSIFVLSELNLFSLFQCSRCVVSNQILFHCISMGNLCNVSNTDFVAYCFVVIITVLICKIDLHILTLKGAICIVFCELVSMWSLLTITLYT